MSGMMLKPSAAPARNQCSRVSATCSGVPTISRWPTRIRRDSSRMVRFSRRARFNWASRNPWEPRSKALTGPMRSHGKGASSCSSLTASPTRAATWLISPSSP
ncbi:hypothetical protein D9M71_659350 [compost metagenome]